MGFAIENAELAARRAEQTHVAGCAYRALSCVAQVLFALNGRYLINEKGAVTEAAAYPITLKGLARTQAEIWRDIGNANHESALRRLHGVSDSLRVLVERPGTKGEAGKVSAEQAPRSRHRGIDKECVPSKRNAGVQWMPLPS